MADVVVTETRQALRDIEELRNQKRGSKRQARLGEPIDIETNFISEHPEVTQSEFFFECNFLN